MRVALDSNILVYAEGVNGQAQRAAASDIVDRLPRDMTLIPAQALGELFNVLVRKAGRSRAQARDTMMVWRNTFAILNTTPEVISEAAELAANHQFTIWDAVILCAASRAGCRLLLSEDMQDGFAWGGVTVVNPFAAKPHPLLAASLKR